MYHLPRGVFLQIQNDICSVISKNNIAAPWCVNLYAQTHETKQVPTDPAEELEKETSGTVEPPESDHPKCADLVVANGGWSFKRIGPQEVSLRRKVDASTLRKIIYCMQFPSYDMRSFMLLLFLPQEIRKLVRWSLTRSLKTMQNH